MMVCKYPFNGKEKGQVSNFAQALAFQKSVERQNKANSIHEQYQAEMQKTIESGAAVKLSDTDLR